MRLFRDLIGEVVRSFFFTKIYIPVILSIWHDIMSLLDLFFSNQDQWFIHFFQVTLSIEKDIFISIYFVEFDLRPGCFSVLSIDTRSTNY